MGYDELIARIKGRSVIVDACLPIQLVEGLKERGVDAIWVPESFGGSAKDYIIASQLNSDNILLTRDVKFAERLGENAILLKKNGMFHQIDKKIPKEPEETTNLKIKRHLRLLFCKRVKLGHKVVWELLERGEV